MMCLNVTLCICNMHRQSCHISKTFRSVWCFKFEYHANENPIKNSEKIAYVGQKLINVSNKKKKNQLTMLVLFLNAIKILGFYIKKK